MPKFCGVTSQQLIYNAVSDWNWAWKPQRIYYENYPWIFLYHLWNQR